MSGLVIPDETVLRLVICTFSADRDTPLLAAKMVTSEVQAWLQTHPNAEDVKMQPTQSQGPGPVGRTSYWYTILLTCYLKEKVERRPLDVRLREKRLASPD